MSHTLFGMRCLWLFVTLVSSALFCMCSVYFLYYVSALHTVLYVFWLTVCHVSGVRNFVMCSVGLFVTLVPRHCFECFLQDFFALVFCTLFWMCSVGSFITLVLQEVFYICFVDGLLPSGVAHCFWCVLLTFCYASVLRTVWYAFSWQFVTLVSCTLFYMFFVDCLSRSCLAHCLVCVVFDCLVC